MPAPHTIVTLLDEDGDEFPVTLPGVFPTNRAGDQEAALEIAEGFKRSGDWRPRGELRVGEIEYVGP